MSTDKRSTPAEREIEKKLNAELNESEERSDDSKAKKLIDKEIEADEK